ncbi:MAG: cyclic nucleotide-binding domain-containing protein [Spirochaetales bacterium]|nr:cyclic nucleotide-binding domain-containing protein [Spirochaetales bacterium]
MPKPVRYKANSIVYFKGDSSESVYILKSGSVLLKYQDIETGQELQDIISTGEFFGVKSALGKYPREETAFVVKDAEMLVFTVPEFESVVMQNTRIIMKMLKVFSNQLRRIHKQLSNLISTGEDENPETGLFKIGVYYQKCGKNVQALYAFRRYLTYYPAGKYVNEANENLQRVELLVQNAPSYNVSSPSVSPLPGASGGASAGSSGGTMSDTAKEYYKGVNQFSQEKFGDALNIFKNVIVGGGDSEYQAKAQFEVGRCLFSMKKYDTCIKHFSAMIQKYPKHPDMLEALLCVGNSYEKKEEIPKAAGFYKKIITMASDGTQIHKKAARALEGLEG